jgi:outer membrane protein insertion porin family
MIKNLYKGMKPVRALLAAGLMFFCVAASGQDVVKVKPEMSYSASATNYVIGGITITGASDYDQNVLLGISGLKVGQVITFPQADDAITTAIRKYWEQRLFSDVSISADSLIGNKIYLNIHLEGRPRLTKIYYHGLKKTEREDLEQRMGLKEGDRIAPNTLDVARTIIRNYFEGKGYKNTKVDIIQRDDSAARNRVKLDINVDKNEKIKVHRIYFTGVDADKVSGLKGAMKKTKEVGRLKNFFRSKKFIADKYAEDKDNIISKYNEWGYRDAYITHDSVVQYDPKHVDVYITVDQGGKYYLRNLSWVGNTVYSADALNRTLGMKRGDVYNQKELNKRLSEDQDAIGNQYYNNGYVFSRVTPVETNVVGDSIDLEVRIVENNQAHLNRVNISGNDRVFEEVIRRELRTKPGDLFNREAIMRSITDLQAMGNFDPEKVEPDIHANPDDGTVDLTYKLKPKSNDQVELSAGWGPMGVTGRVALKFTNFAIQNFLKRDGSNRNIIPQGLGQTFEIEAQTNGTYYQQYSLSFLDPWFGRRRPNQLSVSLFYSKSTDVNSSYYNNYYNNYYSYLYGYGSSSSYYNYANYWDPDKYVKILGGSIGWGKRLRWPDDYFTFSMQLTYQRYMLKQWQYFIMSDGNCNNLNLTFSLNRYSSDQQFFPRRGSDLSMSVSVTPPFSMWDGKNYAALANNRNSATYTEEMKEKYRWVEYHKWKFQFKTYTALTNAVKCPVLMTRTEFGLLGYYNKHKTSPFETFYVGGDGMSGYTTGYATETIGLRGYDNGQLTPYGSEGYAYSRMSLELRYPLMLSSTSLYALAFLEGGNAWTSVRKFNIFDMKRSAGVGVRLWLPMIGLMGIDWAYGFDKVFGKKGGGQFHFVIGHEF